MKRKGRLTLPQLLLLAADLALFIWIAASFAHRNDGIKPTEPTGGSGYSVRTETETPRTQAAGPNETESEAANTEAATDSPETEPPATTAAPATAAPETAPQATETRAPDRGPLSDFVWFDPKNSGAIPAGAKRTAALEDILGEWKAYSVIDPAGAYGRTDRQLMNVTFDAGQFGLIMRTEPLRTVSADGKTLRVSGPEEISEIMAEWDGGVVTAEGAGVIRFDTFYLLNGRLYAVGTVETYESVPGVIAMVKN